MKYLLILSACVLLLWTASVSCVESPVIKVERASDAIKVSCIGTNITCYGDERPSHTLPYADSSSGECVCVKDGRDQNSKMFVKFRTCDNCIELDVASIAGMVVGNVIATVVMGVAVYLVASPTRSSSNSSYNKRPDRKRQVPNHAIDPNNDYQPLVHRGGQRDTYDEIKNRK